MLRSMEHRGPDGLSQHTDHEGGLTIGHLHLNAFVANGKPIAPAFAVTDQHAIALDGGVIAGAAAGAIVGQTRQQMNRDVSAVLSAYRAHGRDSLRTLDGPFALALWDKQKRELLLARGKLGEKSLYYYVDGPREIVVFASEIKAILAHPTVRAELDWRSLSLYLAFGYVPGPRTLLKGIDKLLPGESLVWAAGRPSERHRYWQLPRIGDGVDDEAYCISQLRERFLTGLASYVNGCDDVGVFLSGGVDSSIIVAGLRELGVPRVHTFTVAFTTDPASPRIQEDLPYARLVAQQFGTTHREVVIGPDHDPRPGLLRVVKQFDDLIMTPNAYSKYLLAEAVREGGLNSVLTGSAAAGACGVHRKFLDPKKRAKLERKVEGCTSDEERFFKLRSRLFSLGEQRQLLRRPPEADKAAIMDVLHEYMGYINSNDFFRLFLFANLMITSAEKTLKVLEKATAMAGVEARSPYLDRAVVEFSTQLPSSFDGGRTYVSLKTHLKKAFEQVLPREILERPVIGYPSYYWSRGELDELQERLISREAFEENGIFDYDGVVRTLQEKRSAGAKSAGKHDWALTEFCLWYEVHIKANPAFLLGVS